MEMPHNKKARRGQQTAFITEENELKKWITILRQDGYIVTRSAIRLKAKELITVPSFKASAGWCTRSAAPDGRIQCCRGFSNSSHRYIRAEALEAVGMICALASHFSLN